MTTVPVIEDDFGVRYDSELQRDLYVREGELYQLGFETQMAREDTTEISIELNAVQALIECRG